jgi:hypothetical protein
LEDIVESIDSDCDYSGRKGKRSVPGQEQRVQQIVDDLMKAKVFMFTEGRKGYLISRVQRRASKKR